MRVTTKGQVTIPRRVREKLGIVAQSNVDFREENGRFYICKALTETPKKKFAKFRGIASSTMSTDEILRLTRDWE